MSKGSARRPGDGFAEGFDRIFGQKVACISALPEPSRRASSGKGLVCGIGIYEPRVLCRTDAPHLPRAYRIWNSMLQRASVAYAERHLAYVGMTVDPAFHRFSDFAEWVVQQTGWDQPGFQLDKDILAKGNKAYSPDACVFVPQAINSLMIRASSRRTDLPIGVKRENRSKTQVVATISINGQKVKLGTFRDPMEAFKVYKAAKEEHIKRMAEQYRDQIDPRAYAALMAYQVETTD